jgi:hypothetical protein
MNKRIRFLTAQIRQLEADLREEIERIKIRTFEIRDGTIRFHEEIRRQHKKQMVGLLVYLRRAKLKHVLVAPVIWCCFLPALFLDLTISLYQAVCFPVFGIPKARRSDYIVFDRHHLGYLNIIEKMNCMYCSYFNGLISYIQEIAGRTEQYWCPIKHAHQLRSVHSRYDKFTEFGDAEAFRTGVEEIERDFKDLAAGFDKRSEP